VGNADSSHCDSSVVAPDTVCTRRMEAAAALSHSVAAGASSVAASISGPGISRLMTVRGRASFAMTTTGAECFKFTANSDDLRRSMLRRSMLLLMTVPAIERRRVSRSSARRRAINMAPAQMKRRKSNVPIIMAAMTPPLKATLSGSSEDWITLAVAIEVVLKSPETIPSPSPSSSEEDWLGLPPFLDCTAVVEDTDVVVDEIDVVVLVKLVVVLLTLVVVLVSLVVVDEIDVVVLVKLVVVLLMLVVVDVKLVVVEVKDVVVDV